jgi:predicted Zn-ribbon and HTH transcriptional regulator
MTAGISAKEWHERAKKLNLKWVDAPPRRNDDKTLIRCLDCSNEWLAYPANIAKGKKSCEPCARAASRVPKEVWISRLAEANAIWIKGTPANNSDKSKVGKCQLCNGTWSVDPRRISIGHPRCPGKKKRETVGREDWIQRAKKVGVEWLEIPTRSKTKTPARCLICGHYWKPIPDNIRGGSGCPKCALANPTNPGGQRISSSQWNERAKQAGVRWLKETPTGATVKTPAVCIKCEYEWSPLPSNISKGAGCPRCAKNLPVTQSVWDLRAMEVGLEWLEPVTGGRHSKAKARCLACDYAWVVEVGSVAGGSGCPKCGTEKSRFSRHLDPEVWIARATKANLKWVELPTNNSAKRMIQCQKCAYSWKVIPQTISGGAGCPVCSGVVVEESTWLARATSVNIRWLEIPTSARRPTPAECLRCGLVWKPNPGGVTSGSGCPDCAETGFKVGQPGLFYLVERSAAKGRAARKIGITNVTSSKVRLTLWKRQGFELKLQKQHDDGQLILNLEQNLLIWLRHDRNLPQYLDKEEMPKGGATETFSPDEPPESLLLQKIESEYLALCKKYGKT